MSKKAIMAKFTVSGGPTCFLIGINVDTHELYHSQSIVVAAPREDVAIQYEIITQQGDWKRTCTCTLRTVLP